MVGYSDRAVLWWGYSDFEGGGQDMLFSEK